MRITVDLPDELLRQARSRAAQEGTTLAALLADGLRLRLAGVTTTLTRLPISDIGGGLQPWIDRTQRTGSLPASDAA